MADTSPRNAPAVADGGQDAPGPPDALNGLNMHNTDNTLEISGEHRMRDAAEMEDTHNTSLHDQTDSMCAVLDTVS
jgi:hypothetical protein